MSEAFQTAFSLLAIGMITVFAVLAMVVLVGRGIIAFVNRFVPDELVSASAEKISSTKVAAITAAVDIYTKGKGNVERIEKI